MASATIATPSPVRTPRFTKYLRCCRLQPKCHPGQVSSRVQLAWRICCSWRSAMHYARALDELWREWRELRRNRPGVAIGVVATAFVLSIAPVVLTIWFVISLEHGLPDLDALQRIGEMDQATSVFDDGDKLAFTIYKEQRIEVPLAR